ncbi:MAG: tRNA (guanosine(46)-N7)-methyltransferase TrmB [Eubacteriales bacterium]|nr:tRNA (guanosine(46)-N7)-methyltransferase TrmB [Eubacteriales bacterium]
MRLRNIPGSVEVIQNSGYVVQDPEEKRGKWAEVFGNENPLYIEIGMGKGRFLMDMAEAHPDCNFVGIEMYDSVLFRGVQKAEMREARRKAIAEGKDPEGIMPIPAKNPNRPAREENCNFRFLRMDARDLENVFAEKEIDGIYLNFSDPWPKDRHANRRLTSRAFLKRYVPVLKTGAKVEFKTDNRELFDFSLEEVKEAGWTLEAFTYDLHHNEEMNRGNIMTEYEEKFSSQGNPINKLIARP